MAAATPSASALLAAFLAFGRLSVTVKMPSVTSINTSSAIVLILVSERLKSVRRLDVGVLISRSANQSINQSMTSLGQPVVRPLHPVNLLRHWKRFLFVHV